MDSYVKIYRSFTPRRFYLKAFNSEDYEYMWMSRTYRWLWLARWHGVRAARKHLALGALVASGRKVKIISMNRLSHSPGFFEESKELRGWSTRIFIERIEL